MNASVGTYLKAAGALLALLALTVVASLLPLGRFGVVVALLIAGMKAALILLIFMNVRTSSRLTQLFAVAGFFWVLIFFLLTFGDYVTRG